MPPVSVQVAGVARQASEPMMAAYQLPEFGPKTLKIR